MSEPDLTDTIEIDDETGKVTFKNTNEPVELTYGITVTNSGGSEGEDFNPTLVIEGFKITTTCGAGSTIITAPALEDFLAASELGESAKTSGTFTSSNVNCPIESVVLDSGEGFEITDNGDGQFDVTLELEKSTKADSYSYTAKATAANGNEVEFVD